MIEGREKVKPKPWSKVVTQLTKWAQRLLPPTIFARLKSEKQFWIKIKVCGTFIIKFLIEIHLLKDDSRYHENKWHSLVMPEKLFVFWTTFYLTISEILCIFKVLIVNLDLPLFFMFMSNSIWNVSMYSVTSLPIPDTHFLSTFCHYFLSWLW